MTLALNYNKSDRNPQRMSKIKPFIEEYNWRDIDFPSTSKDWKKFELNNELALNILYVPHNTKKIEIAYKSKHNLTREKQIDSDKGYILDVDVDYASKLHRLHSDIPFLPERMKIDKTQKLVCNLHDKKKYVVHISRLKQALNHGLKLKKVHRVIEFNQEAWLKNLAR